MNFPSYFILMYSVVLYRCDVCLAFFKGPDGGIGASKYCYMGGFDATRYFAINYQPFTYSFKWYYCGSFIEVIESYLCMETNSRAVWSLVNERRCHGAVKKGCMLIVNDSWVANDGCYCFVN